MRPGRLASTHRTVRLRAGQPGTPASTGRAVANDQLDQVRVADIVTRTALDTDREFHNSRHMESVTAIEALGALAQNSRLQVYRLLVQAGPEGLAASELAERLDIPANTLSFHLKTLSHADLVLARQEGRFIYYSANYEQMNALLAFLTENCCGGRSCEPKLAAPRKRRA